MVIQDRIRLTGLLTRSPALRGFAISVRLRAVLCAALFGAIGCGLGLVAAAGSAVSGREPGYEYILDGTATGTRGSFDRWLMAPSGSFTRRADGSIRSRGGLGLLWYPRRFGDISLKLEYRDGRTTAGFSNGGVFVRFPDLRVPVSARPKGWSYRWTGRSGPWPAPRRYSSNPTSSDPALRAYCGRIGGAGSASPTGRAWYAIHCGHEIQVNDSPATAGDPKKTGSIYDFADLDASQSRTARRLERGWHTLEIVLVRQQYSVLVDGRILNQFDNATPAAGTGGSGPPTPARQFAGGYVGLQNHGPDDVVDYRNVRVRTLRAPPATTRLPEIAGSGVVGTRLTCAPGRWRNVGARGFSFAWFRSNAKTTGTPRQADLATIAVGRERQYRLVAADLGKVVHCRVTARTRQGITWATRRAPAARRFSR